MALTKEQIKTRIAELDALIDPLVTERANLKQQLLELKSAFVVGDIIRWQYGKKYRYGLVIEIRDWVCGEPMWIVRNIRKDGTDGDTVKIHSWQKPVIDTSCATK